MLLISVKLFTPPAEHERPYLCDQHFSRSTLACLGVQFTFVPVFGLAERMRNDPAQSCTRDYVKIFDGSGVELRKFCHLTAPSPVTVSTSSARVVLYAGSYHNSKRKGFKITYQSVDL